jgi:hypothetical protein
MTFTVNASLFLKVLNLAKEVVGDDGGEAVTLRFYGANKPVRFTTDKCAAVQMDALLMPMETVNV